MPASDITLLSFVGFIAAFLALIWLSRQVSLRVQALVYWITGSMDLATVVIFLIFLPGVWVHEAAHWFVAQLLGLRTGRFRVWPQKRGKYIGMGSVSIHSGGPLADSLVGMAPLIIGSTLVTLIGTQVFNASQISDAWNSGRWLDGLLELWHSLGRHDGLLWAYLLFAVANAMMPSASDREPMKPVLLYLVLAGTVYFLLDLPLSLVTSALRWLVEPLQLLSSALLLTLVLDALLLVALFLLQGLVMAVRRG